MLKNSLPSGEVRTGIWLIVFSQLDWKSNDSSNRVCFITIILVRACGRGDNLLIRAVALPILIIK